MVYYIETNIIAIVVAVILLIQGRKMSSVNETSHILLNEMLRILAVVAASDIAAFYFRGKSFAGIQAANIVYFLIIAVGAYIWFLYILVVTEQVRDLKKTILMTGFPTMILCVVILTNPWNGFFFTVDEQLLYHRGPGILITWVIEWVYLILATFINLRCYIREQRSYKKSEYKGYLLFMVPLVIASACQMLFYGTTSIQIGFMIALLMAFINKQHFQVQRDDLTGLNNKNAFLNYRDSMLNQSREIRLTMFMMDLDKFKTINDVYGHIKGDQALRDTAEVLRSSVAHSNKNRASIYRYGGDEFIILASDCTEEDIENMKSIIQAGLDEKNKENHQKGEAYVLLSSIGTATMDCRSIADFDELLLKSDKAMYEIKKKHGRGR